MRRALTRKWHHAWARWHDGQAAELSPKVKLDRAYRLQSHHVGNALEHLQKSAATR